MKCLGFAVEKMFRFSKLNIKIMESLYNTRIIDTNKKYKKYNTKMNN